MNRFLCIHGHFYQPPRENAWLEAIEIQDSASPYHDWNERINAECYSPNSAARILSGDNRIIDIINNYSKTSFNFGPTLLSWMEQKAPETYEAILEADRISQTQFSGHGSALAQVYNHMIMPLANSRDKHTQVYWGIRDFQHRFGRDPEGMWLPETAVDLETLEVLAQYGIKFTILSPYQAARIRTLEPEDPPEEEQTDETTAEEQAEDWIDVSGGKIDPKRPYLCQLPSGQSITIFFYDGPISQEVGFGDVLSNGEKFANRLMGAFAENGEENQLTHIATDGETYGHHHSHGDMALAYCLYYVESHDLADLTIYGEYLENNPPTYEVEIQENSSWSCVHGVERWRSNCGCKIGGHPGWTQEWRKPLRETMDWLRDKVGEVYEQAADGVLPDPWKSRDEYISVLHNRGQEHVKQFLAKQAGRQLEPEEETRALHLLEMQRHGMLMFTSCGWFFDEISGLEATQVIQYADRSIQMAQEIAHVQLEDEFSRRLEAAPSNIPDIENGATVYTKYIKPARLDMLRVGAHYAVSSLFEDYPDLARIYCYTTRSEAYDHAVSGKLRLGIGRVWVKSDITWHESLISFAVLYLGEHILNGGVREFRSEDDYETMHQEIRNSFVKSDISDVFGLLDKHLGTHSYTLWHLFKDEQRKVFDQILESTLERIEFSFRRIYEDEYPLMQAMRELHLPLPRGLSTSLEYIINADLRKLLASKEIDCDRLKELIEEVRRWNVSLDAISVRFAASQRIVRRIKKLSENPDNIVLMEQLRHLLGYLQDLPVDLNLWEAQNIYFDIGKRQFKLMEERAEQGEEFAQEWLEHFTGLEDYLQVKLQ